ncbi:MAG: TraB family protein [Methanobacteriota archaeon]|nr:MAG: TraB family protein [Euryarchaeota archaeon]|tara:strand:+ start:9297 stop:10466 length:1170 start_codon:yes stop_codon:yes gene_type:complete
MSENNLVISIEDSIRLVGTAHVSKESVDLVREQIESWDPDFVAVELCESRYNAILENRRLDKESLLKVIKEGKAPLVLTQSLLAAEQRRLGLSEDLQPGAELIEAVNVAKQSNKKVILIDRDIQTTLRRAWKRMKLREKFGLLWSLVGENDSDEDEFDINEILRNKDLMTLMMDELKQVAPGAGTVLVDERDEFLAHKILQYSSDGKILAVIGAGHLDGVTKHLHNLNEPNSLKLEHLSELPKKKIYQKIIPWVIPLVLFGFIIKSGLEKDFNELAGILTTWAIANSLSAAIAVVLARGHILSVITAAIASPITSLNPFLAAGWFAGYVQLKVDEPTTEDLTNFLKLEDWKSYWTNPAGKVLLVTALGNLGSMSGAWIAASIIGIFGAI